MTVWVSVLEQIPPRFCDVLVFLRRGSIEIRHITDEEYPCEADPYQKYVWNDQGIVNDITHWMPLPQHPELPK